MTQLTLLVPLFIFSGGVSWSTGVFVFYFMLLWLMILNFFPSWEGLVVQDSGSGLDLLSWSMLLLTSIILIFMILNTSNSFVSKKSSFSYLIHLFLLTALSKTFLTTSLIMFFVSFEFSALLIFVMVLSWGYQPERIYASYMLLLYTIVSSLPFLVMILGMSVMTQISDFSAVTSYCLSSSSEESGEFFFSFLVMFGFLVKFPIYFFHLWLPKAHVEASSSGSMLLAGVLLKLGGYGLLRFSNLLLFSNLSVFVANWSIMGGAVISVLCLRQKDFKVLIAYSSVAHMSLAIASILMKSQLGFYASVTLMIAHGLISSLMFFMSGTMYYSSHSRLLNFNSGMLSTIPLFSFFWFLGCMSNMGTPPTLNFWSELLSIIAIFSSMWTSVFFLSVMLFFGVAYSMVLYSFIQSNKSSETNYNSFVIYFSESLVMALHFYLSVSVVFFLGALSFK